MRKPNITPVEVHFDTAIDIPTIEALAKKDGMKRKKWLEVQVLMIINRRRNEIS